jgi:hypothetical protein
VVEEAADVVVAVEDAADNKRKNGERLRRPFRAPYF